MPVPVTLADGTPFYPPDRSAPERRLLLDRAEDERRPLLVRRLRLRAAPLGAQPQLPVVLHVVAQRRHHAGLDLLLRRHERHRLLLPGVPARLQQGPGRLPHHPQLGLQRRSGTCRSARDATGAARALLAGWQLAAIGQLRSGPPLTLFVGANRSRSRWSPSIGPGQGFDRPSLAPGYTTDERGAWRSRPVVRPGGVRAAAGGHLRRPRPRRALRARPAHASTSRSRSASRGRGSGPAGHVELRVEAFNVFNRANFGIPSLQAFAGTRRQRAAAPDARPHPPDGHLGPPDPARPAPPVLRRRRA